MHSPLSLVQLVFEGMHDIYPLWFRRRWYSVSPGSGIKKHFVCPRLFQAVYQIILLVVHGKLDLAGKRKTVD